MNSNVAGKCYEFSAHKRIIEHFTQDWPQLDSRPRPSVAFDPEVTSRTKKPKVLAPPDFLFTPSTNERPDVPAVEGYRLVIERSWVKANVRESEEVYNEYQDVESHPALNEGKWEFDADEDADYSWLGTPADAPNASYYQSWQLYAVVDGQERPAALAPGPYEFVDPLPNQVLWGASDLPPGHFMWPDVAYSEDLIKYSATWDEIAETARPETIDGEERIVYTVDWTLEIDSFWEDHGVPVYPGLPAGPMTGYMLDLWGRPPETAHLEVTAANFLEVGFGGKFQEDDDDQAAHPRFWVGDEGTTDIAAIVAATPFSRDDTGTYWAGDPTYLEFRVTWVDEKADSEQCGKRGQQCCFLENNSCDYGECREDETCGGCGEPGDPCCEDEFCTYANECTDGTCVPVPVCDNTVHYGANDAEIITVDAMSVDGAGTFHMTTFDVPDQMIVRDSKGKKILETPCVGTSKLASLFSYCNTQPNFDGDGKCFYRYEDNTYATCYDWSSYCQFANGWKCKRDFDSNGYECWAPYSYAGGSLLTVQVIPDCDGVGDTLWEFMLGCPE